MTTDEVKAAITQTALNRGVDPAFALAVAWQESRYNPAAVSPVGAVGVFQLMPSTARGLGVDANDPAQNIQGGVEYLGQLLDKYQGNMALALAAFNAGPGNVAKYNGVPPFAETMQYVSNILASLGASVSSGAAGIDGSGSVGFGLDTVGTGIAIAVGLFVLSRLVA